MVSIDYSVFLQVANFIVLLIILNFFLFKPIIKALNERRQKIDAADQDCRKLETDLAERIAVYESRLNQARIEASNVRHRLVNEAKEAAARVMDEVNRDVLETGSEFERNMRAEVDRCRELLRSQSEWLSVEITETVLGRSIR